MKTKTLHMIGNAHIDPVWLWQWHEGFHEVKATFRSALDRMKEYDDFIFTASSAAFYEWVEQSDPAMFAEIQQRVREGRWSITGGWWVEPDCNIPCGESFVRQGLYGQRYFKEKFGVTATVGFNVDSFGHAASLPQILKKSGIDYYTFLRPMPHEKGIASRLFWWEAGDGSRVMAFRIPFEYLSWGKDIAFHALRCVEEIKAPFDEIMCFYGVGNHGGGPTIENLESIRCLNADPSFPARLVFSRPEALFKNAEAKGWRLPVVHEDLQMHATGCYSVHSGIKRWNRQAENRLQAAEKLSTVAAWVTGQPYPADLERAWKSVLFNQFHDILAGTSLEAAYDDARDQYGEALAIADRALNHAVQALAWKIRIQPEEGMQPLVVFNPHTWPVKTCLEMEFKNWKSGAVLIDDSEGIIPYQASQSSTTTSRVRLCFTADLPALGYRTYRFYPQAPTVLSSNPSVDMPAIAPLNDAAYPRAWEMVNASDQVLENRRFRLEFDPRTGDIMSLRDLQAGVEVFSGPAARPVVIDDPSDTWGHDVFKFDRVIGAFQATSVRLVTCGPVKAVIRVMSEYGASRLIQDFAMYPDRDPIDVSVTVDWREQHKMLKLRFPVNVKFMKVTHEIPYGHQQRFANGEELPFQSWVDVSGTSRDRDLSYGLSLLNDGKYSLDVNVRDIGLTVLRSPAYAHHTPAALQPGEQYTFIDQGIQRFQYSLLPHTGSWEQAGTVKRAAERNQRPFPLLATFHPDGPLPQCDSYIHVEPENILVSVLKQAEDAQHGDLILRAYETAGHSTRAVITLMNWNRRIEAEFGPGEIKTFRIPRDPDQPIIKTNLLEWE